MDCVSGKILKTKTKTEKGARDRKLRGDEEKMEVVQERKEESM